MPYPKIYIDAMLLNWGDRLFSTPFWRTGAPHLSRAWLRDEASRMRDQLARTLGHSPEVFVKITNKASSAQGVGALRRHLRYISRNGQLALEDEHGEQVKGRDAVRELVLTWQLGGWGLPEASEYREVFNILLSMPPGTNRQAMRHAARGFAALEFGDGRSYVFAVHEDVPHPHIHLSIQARGPDGRRLHPRHADLQRWRERFAAQLRAHGVDANATPRRVRGVTQRYPGQGVAHMLARGEVPRYWQPVATAAQREAVWRSHGEVIAAWRELAQAMAASTEVTDRAMAIGIANFVKAMSVWPDAPVVQHRLALEPLQRTRSVPEQDARPGGPTPELDR